MDSDPATVYLDPSGDLGLSVDYEALEGEKIRTKTFVVSTSVMCLASPVWRAMFDPQGHWAKQSSHKEFYLLDDDPDALVIILRIAHLQFWHLPLEPLDYTQLVQIAVLCDKYDTVELVRPFLPKWQKDFGELEAASASNGYSGSEAYLFVAWTFGYSTLFKNVTRALILNTTTDEEGHLLNDRGEVIDVVMPPDSVGEL